MLVQNGIDNKAFRRRLAPFLHLVLNESYRRRTRSSSTNIKLSGDASLHLILSESSGRRTRSSSTNIKLSGETSLHLVLSESSGRRTRPSSTLHHVLHRAKSHSIHPSHEQRCGHNFSVVLVAPAASPPQNSQNGTKETMPIAQNVMIIRC